MQEGSFGYLSDVGKIVFKSLVFDGLIAKLFDGYFANHLSIKQFNHQTH